MNDRFKFRVFCLERQEMLYPCRVDFFGNGLRVYLVNSILDNAGDSWTFERTFLANEVIIMQCTGLKDSEGKLIYEGDILSYRQFWWDEDDKDKIIEVKFGEFQSCGCCSTVGGVGFDLGIDFDKDDTLKIIGNIYLNKDLLDEHN